MSDRDTTLELLRPDPGRRRRERWIRRAFLATALLGVLVSAGIVVSLIGRAASFLAAVDLSALWSLGWFPRRGAFDLRALIVGSLLVSSLAMLVAGPLGLGAAIYLSEYAGDRLRRIVKPILEILAGVPSVVLGFFALTFITPTVVQPVFAQAGVYNYLSASIAVGILVSPLMASVSEDALRAVPDELRQAAFGMGARRRAAVTGVVVPAAVSGIVAAFILSISRAIGETMVVTIAAGATGLLNADPRGGGLTMTSAIANIATGSDAVAGAVNAVDGTYLVGLVLFAFTLGLNVVGDRVVRRFRTRY